MEERILAKNWILLLEIHNVEQLIKGKELKETIFEELRYQHHCAMGLDKVNFFRNNEMLEFWCSI